MLQDVDNSSVRYTRIFNFNERRVGLRMEVSERGQEFIPMGRIDVLEIPTNNGRVTCSCTLTELQTGNSQRIILRLKNVQEREKEVKKCLFSLEKFWHWIRSLYQGFRRQKLLMQRNQQERVFPPVQEGLTSRAPRISGKKRSSGLTWVTLPIFSSSVRSIFSESPTMDTRIDLGCICSW